MEEKAGMKVAAGGRRKGHVRRLEWVVGGGVSNEEGRGVKERGRRHQVTQKDVDETIRLCSRN